MSHLILTHRALRAAKRDYDRPKQPFHRDIFSKNLHDRAVVAGVGADYEAYRVLSGVVHGDAGGLYGLTRELRGGIVHRLGPDLQLLPLAYLYGYRWYSMLMREAAQNHGMPAATQAAEHAA